jgi:hypothetical protein
MNEIDHAAIMWNKTKLEFWKKKWYELVKNLSMKKNKIYKKLFL